MAGAQNIGVVSVGANGDIMIWIVIVQLGPGVRLRGARRHQVEPFDDLPQRLGVEQQERDENDQRQSSCHPCNNY